MKLRNKKTGEVVDAVNMTVSTPCEPVLGYEASDQIGEYASLAELNEYWEDYKPAEPLIKDEKIRKAVRVWAEACGYNGACIVEYDKRFNELSGIAHTTVIALGEIDFDLEDRKRYTIAELCGDAPEYIEVVEKKFDTSIDVDDLSCEEK